MEWLNYGNETGWREVVERKDETAHIQATLSLGCTYTQLHVAPYPEPRVKPVVHHYYNV